MPLDWKRSKGVDHRFKRRGAHALKQLVERRRRKLGDQNLYALGCAQPAIGAQRLAQIA